MLCGISTAAWAKQVTLRFAGRSMTDAELAAYKDLFKQFEAQNPNIKVGISNYDLTEYDSKILVEMAAATPPDLMYVHYSRFPQYAKVGAFLPLTKYIQRDNVKRTDYFPSTLQQLTYKGQADLALPRETSSIVLFYNQEALDEAGLDYPGTTWTYDDLLNAAKNLTIDRNGDGKPEQWGFRAPTDWFLRVNLIWSFGGKLLNDGNTEFVMNQPGAVSATQWIVDLMHKHRVAPPTQVASFASGQAAMMMSGFWDIGPVNKVGKVDWDVALLPSGPAGRVVRTASGGYAIPARSKNPDEAWELLKFLSSKKSHLILAAGTTIPALKSASYSREFLNVPGNPRNRKVFIDSLNYGRPDPVTTVWAEMLDAINKALDSVWKAEKSPVQALSEAKPVVDAILKKQ